MSSPVNTEPLIAQATSERNAAHIVASMLAAVLAVAKVKGIDPNASKMQTLFNE